MLPSVASDGRLSEPKVWGDGTSGENETRGRVTGGGMGGDVSGKLA